MSRCSGWRPVMSVICQGLALGMALFDFFVCDRDSGIQCTLGKFAMHTKLCGAVDTLEGRDAIQRGLVRWKGGPMQSSGCSVRPSARSCTWVRTIQSINTGWVEHGEELGVLINDMPNMSWQCALVAQKAKHVLGCIKSSVTSRSRKVFNPLRTPEELRIVVKVRPRD
ncbi:hypothetical protein TURU_067535 [Turdus rufiventris]|nr:hypothetical protein TURU_067535 [Turdus rufiventris]